MKKIKAFGLVTIIVIALVSSILTNKPILVNNNDNQIVNPMMSYINEVIMGDIVDGKQKVIVLMNLKEY